MFNNDFWACVTNLPFKKCSGFCRHSADCRGYFFLLGFRVQALGLRVYGSVFRLQGLLSEPSCLVGQWNRALPRPA